MRKVTSRPYAHDIPSMFDRCTGCDTIHAGKTEQAVMLPNGMMMTCLYCDDCIAVVLSGTADVQPVGVPDVWLVDGPTYLGTLEGIGNAWADGRIEAGSPTADIPQWSAGHSYSLFAQWMADCWFGMDNN